MYDHLSLLFTYFFLYSVIGWCCEVVYCSIPKRKFINRGFLNGPYCPIYGFGALIIVALLGPYINDPVTVFLIGVAATSLLEYITSWAMEKLFHAKWWDYSDRKFNINGRVCLRNSLLFGVMSLVLMYVVHPFAVRIVSRFSSLWLEVTATALAALMLADLITSTLETLHFKNKLSRVSELAAGVTDDLREKGVATKAQLAQKIADVRSTQYERLESTRDDVQRRVEDFIGRLSEKAPFRRYSHRRIINAFPGMIPKDDPDSLNLYREALLHLRKLRRLRRKAAKQAKKSQEK